MPKCKYYLSSQKGFSLVELIVAVSIIGILASIALPSFSVMMFKAQVRRIEAELAGMQSVLRGLYELNGRYPDSVGAGYPSFVCRETGKFCTVPQPSQEDFLALWVEMRNSPQNSLLNPAGAQFQAYVYYGNGTDYKLIGHDMTSYRTPPVSATFIDPVRTTWGFGYWTPGAAGF